MGPVRKAVNILGAVVLIVGVCWFLAFVFLTKHHPPGTFPITLNFRRALVGPGYVVILGNNADSSLRVKVSALGKTYENIIDHKSSWNLSDAYASGDKLSVTADGETQDFVIPEIALSPNSTTPPQNQAPLPPISPSFREALIGGTKVLVLKRNKDSVKDIYILCSRPLTGAKMEFSHKNWGVRNLYELGHTEGWGFLKGDTVKIWGSEIEPINLTVE
jgi:hypothetical protein